MFLSPILANIITCMLRTGVVVPDSVKRDVIVTLHNSGNKRKDIPDNYRVTYVIRKLFECVLLHRSKQTILDTVSQQQGGFRVRTGFFRV